MKLFKSKIIKNSNNNQHTIRIPPWLFKSGELSYNKDAEYLILVIPPPSQRDIDGSKFLQDKSDLLKFGFVFDEHLDEYIKKANIHVRNGWPGDVHILNSVEELQNFSWDNKVEFIASDRIGKLNWKEIRLIYDHIQLPKLEIHTYNGFSLSITQSCVIFKNIGIPGLKGKESIDTFDFESAPTFSFIHFFGNFEFTIPLTFLRE